MKTRGRLPSIVCFVIIGFLVTTAVSPVGAEVENGTPDIISGAHDEAAGGPDRAREPRPQADSPLRSEVSLAFSASDYRFDYATWQDPETAGESPVAEGPSMEEIAEMINNPLGNLWMLFTQTDLIWFEGDLTKDTRTGVSTKFMPVMPLKLTNDWSLILRPVFQYNSFEVPNGFDLSPPALPRPSRRRGNSLELDFGRETGLGDTVLMTSFSKWTKPPRVLGFGPTFMFPTATNDALGTEKWSAGPSVLGVYVGEKWIVGGVLQHWWSFAGD